VDKDSSIVIRVGKYRLLVLIILKEDKNKQTEAPAGLISRVEHRVEVVGKLGRMEAREP
jgi:hypothetical protein